MSKKKKSIFLICTIVLLALLSGLGVFFLTQNKGQKVVVEDGLEVFDGYGDISWYDEAESEFVLTTKEELYGMGRLSKSVDFYKKTVKLGADIVLNDGNVEEWAEDAPEYVWQPIDGFKGTFDGQGHTISGLYMNQSDMSCGMFSNTDAGCTIQDFKLVNSLYDVISDDGVGAITSNGGGTYKRIYTDAIVKCAGWHVGGLMGAMQQASIFDECWFDGEVSITGRYGGGIIGAVVKSNGTMMHCLNSGSVTSTFPGPQAATLGGLCGNIGAKMVVSDSLAVGVVTSTEERPEVGGAMGVVSGATLTADSTWTSSDSATKAIGSIVSDKGGKLTGACLQLAQENLIGYGGYQRTDLDFDKYWAVVEDSTPILQYFADEVPSLEGIVRGWAPDTSWYSKTKTEFVINTPEELYGLAALSAGGENFYGRMIKLGSDIKYNEGKASDYAKDVPLNIWLPITNFNGNFDGQGHTISGLYCKQYDDVGLFGNTKSKCTVKNLRLENSYFECTDEKGDQGVAGISAMGGGTFENIYCDAIVKTVGWYAGGIVGAMNEGGKVSNCWFDGSVTLGMRNGGGIVGASLHYRGGEVKTKTEIVHCLNTGTIYRNVDENNVSATVGGICGLVTNEMTMDDCLNVGNVSSKLQESGKRMDEIGSIIACIASKAKVTVDNCYALDESCWTAITTIKEDATANIGIALRMTKENLTGYLGYQFTNLDFKNYWAVVLDGTPVLRKFAKSIPSTAGILKGDTSWYTKNPNANEFIIDSKEDLYGLAILSAGNTFEGKTIKLAADIVVNSGDAAQWAKGENIPSNAWTPIKNFAGTFEGQGHTISGLYGVATETDQMGMGLFAKTAEKAVVQNLQLKNTYFETESIYGLSAISSRGCGTFKNIYANAILKGAETGGAGGFLGVALAGKVRVENCWFDGTITDAGRRVAGIIGNSNGQTIDISHCLNSGTIYRNCGKDAKSFGMFGGLIGTASGKITISDCLNAGTVTSDKANDAIGSVIGEGCKESVTMTNVYTVAESCAKAIGHNMDKTSIAPTRVTFLDNYIGLEAAYQTNLDFNNYWAARNQTYPALKMFVAEGDRLSIPSTKPSKMIPDTSWYSDALATKTFTITKPEQLLGLAELTWTTENFGGWTIKLGADLKMNDGLATDWAEGKNLPENEWITIGNGTKANFNGKFYGEGYEISGIYCVQGDMHTGLFGVTTINSRIKDFKLVNSYFESATQQGTGAIVGFGGGEMKKIYTDAIVKNTYIGKNRQDDGLNNGGILGRGGGDKDHVIVIENCWFAGKIDTTGQNSGGIVGYTESKDVQIKNCLNSGTISRTIDGNANASLGGICGKANSKITIDGCLSRGIVTSNKFTTSYDEIGAVIGSANGDASVVVKNTWWTPETCDDMANGTQAASDGFGVNNAKSKDVAGCNKVSFKVILGDLAKDNTTLDFTSIWSVVEEKAPVLTIFKKYAANDWVPDFRTKADTSWFNTTTNSGVIDSPEDLYGFAELSKTSGTFNAQTVITLGADIELNKDVDVTTVTEAPTDTWSPIRNFPGTFKSTEGKRYKISGLYGTTTTSDSLGMGLFAQTAQTAVIQDIILENCYFANTHSKGAAAITSRGGGNYRNIYVKNNVVVIDKLADNNIESCAGGILGEATSAATIENCWFAGSVTANGKFTGGMVGSGVTSVVTIKHCLNSGTITREGGKFDNSGLGGMCGFSGGTITIEDCLNVGSIVDKDNHLNEVGAIVGALNGNSKGTIKNTWGLKGSAGKVVGVNNGSLTNNAAFVDSVAGKNAFEIGLDYTTYWAARENTYPALKSFVAESEWLPVPGVAKLTADTSWYQGAESTKTYTITTAAELMGLAQKTSEGVGFGGWTIKLGADIKLNDGLASDWAKGENIPINTWTTIGNNTNANFNGTFDGQGYTISGVYCTGSVNVGLFGVTTINSVIKDFHLENSYFSNTGYYTGSIAGVLSGKVENVQVQQDVYINATNIIVGGIAGRVSTNDTRNMISNCEFAGKITTTNNCVGGILGNLFGNGGVNASVTLDNCLFSGTITGTKQDASIGGFVGQVSIGANASPTLTIKDSLNVGTIINAKYDYVAHIVGRVYNPGSAIVTNTYAKASSNYSQLATWSGVSTENQAKLKAVVLKEQYLKGGFANTYTTLDFDTYWTTVPGKMPVLTEFKDKAVTGEATKLSADTSWYTNALNNGKTYTITTAEELMGLAQKTSEGVNFGSWTIKLGADIKINEGFASDWAKGENIPINTWTTIGNNTNANFNGTFDGQGYTISGVYCTGSGYIGLFGVTTINSVIKDFHLENSYFNNTGYFTGSIAGVLSGKVENVQVQQDVYINATNIIVGGIAGRVSTNDTRNMISNCEFAGKITTTNNCVGGILGNLFGNGGVNASVTLDNCLFSGTITGTKQDASIGGFVGQVSIGANASPTLTIKDSLNVGTIINAKYDYVAHIVGRVYNPGSAIVTNTYAKASSNYNQLATWSGVSATIQAKLQATVVSEENLVGDLAKTNTALNFDTNWTVLSYKTPVLTKVAPKEASGASAMLTFTRWMRSAIMNLFS